MASRWRLRYTLRAAPLLDVPWLLDCFVNGGETDKYRNSRERTSFLQGHYFHNVIWDYARQKSADQREAMSHY